jgi:diketogulonate reductase-like aldo/keto reductase
MVATLRMVLVVGVAARHTPTITIGKDVHGVDVALPLVGAGTWQYNDTTAYDSLCKAFAAGYNMVDTANGYGNEKGVGQAIRDCWKGSRKELFVMTKIPGGLNTSETLAAHKENMELLGLEYVDHLMTHYPADWDATPERANPKRRQEEWMALESVYKTGEARSIGVSHYCTSHIDDVLAVATVRPSINQVEYHVGAGDVDHVIEKCEKEKIFFMSYSPLCGPCDYKPEDSLINGKLVTSIAKRYNVSGAQISLRWIVQQALSRKHIAGVIPKSNDADHIASNLDIFGFRLSEEDMNLLSAASQPAGEPGDCDVTVAI